MNCWLALSYAIEARTSAGADAAGVMAGAPQAVAGGVGEGFAEGLLDAVVEGLGARLGVGLVALGFPPQATELKRAITARESSRLAIGGDYGPLAEDFLQKRVRYLGVGLRRSFLDVGHQRAQGLLLPSPVVFDRSRVRRDHRLHDRLD